MSDQAKKLIEEAKAIGTFHAERAAAYTGGPKPFRHNGHDREAACPWLTDTEVASAVRMLTRYDLDHEGVVNMARDRILHLSQTRVSRDDVIEECALVVEEARVIGQKYHWWGAFWNYFNDPFPDRDKLAALLRSLKSTNKPL